MTRPTSWDVGYDPATIVWCLRDLLCQNPLSMQPVGVVCDVWGGSVAREEEEDETIATRSVKWEVIEWHEQGYRPSMEDASFHAEFSTGRGKYLLCGVVDGHGGVRCAEYVGRTMVRNFS